MHTATMKDMNDYEIDVVKFWRWVDICGEDDCWEWRGGKNTGGYGLFSLPNRAADYERTGRTKSQLLAHRVAFHVSVAALDSSVHICHSCDNPKCCNPKHLWRGSIFDNVQDMITKGRAHWQQPRS